MNQIKALTVSLLLLGSHFTLAGETIFNFMDAHDTSTNSHVVINYREVKNPGFDFKNEYLSEIKQVCIRFNSTYTLTYEGSSIELQSASVNGQKVLFDPVGVHEDLNCSVVYLSQLKKMHHKPEDAEYHRLHSMCGLPNQ